MRFPLIISMLLILIFIIPDVYAISSDDLEWFGGTTYKLTQKDNMVTEKGYTIKAVEFPAPVRGIKTINGSIPERPVTPFVRLNIYKDMANNSNPISNITLGIGDEYITDDQELKITVVNMPRNMSSSWVYEYYNPWVSLKIQKRAIPILSIKLKLADIKEDFIDPGDTLKMDIRIKNVGNDTVKNVNFDINLGGLSLKSIYGADDLTDTIYKLDKDEEIIINMTLIAPTIVERRDYNIYVNATGYDSLDQFHSWSVSKKISVRNITELITVNKTTRNSIYLKENINVVLSISNVGHLYMENIKIYDFIPDKLSLVKDNVIFKNTTEIFLEKNSLGSGESFTYTYTLKPTEPGVYLLPKFKTNFSIGGKGFNLISNEQGFRVFGPKIVLNKSVMYKGNDLININVNVKNIGNGVASRVKIEDQLPVNATLISGNIDMLTSLEINEQKFISYTIRIPNFRGVKSTYWPSANSIYYLDDYKFSSSSEGIIEEISKDVLKNDTSMVPTISEVPKKVVATIPVKTPKKTPEKGIPGFRFYELLGIIVTIILLGKNFIGKGNKK